MGYKTNLICSITFNRKTYNHKSEVENDLDIVKTDISKIKRYISKLVVITEPDKFFDKENGDIIGQIELNLDNSFYDLGVLYYEKFKLETLLENWDKCHNKDGLAIVPPEKDISYLYGDYIKTNLNSY